MFGSHICQLIKLSGRPAVHSGTGIYYFLSSRQTHFINLQKLAKKIKNNSIIVAITSMVIYQSLK